MDKELIFYHVTFTFLEPQQGYLPIAAYSPEEARASAEGYLQKHCQGAEITDVIDKTNEQKETLQ